MSRTPTLGGEDVHPPPAVERTAQDRTRLQEIRVKTVNSGKRPTGYQLDLEHFRICGFDRPQETRANGI